MVDVGLGLQVSGDGVLVAVADGEVCASRLVRLPAVVTIAEDGNQPRVCARASHHPGLRHPGAVEVISASDLGLVEAELRPRDPARRSLPARAHLRPAAGGQR